jgi:transposase-like protein
MAARIAKGGDYIVDKPLMVCSRLFLLEKSHVDPVEKYFHSTPAAFEHLEKILWAGEPVCPHCGTVGNATKLQGESTRPGLWKCKIKECRKQFAVTVGTVFESRHIPLPKMLQAAYLMSCSKKGVSSHQLHRILKITYKSAWFLTHRIREAMRDGSLAPMGAAGSVVEADETYFGPVDEPSTTRTSSKPFTKGATGIANKRCVVSLVERGGSVRSFHVDRADKATITAIVTENVVRESKPAHR